MFHRCGARGLIARSMARTGARCDGFLSETLLADRDLSEGGSGAAKSVSWHLEAPLKQPQMAGPAQNLSLNVYVSRPSTSARLARADAWR